MRQDPDQLLVHELTHQWFGDSVTPLTWADIWLNEGPAVYFQWSWAESVGGPTLEESARISWDAADDSMDVPPGDPGEDELFGRSVYERSAMFLIELEHLMGTESFDQLLRTWLDGARRRQRHHRRSSSSSPARSTAHRSPTSAIRGSTATSCPSCRSDAAWRGTTLSNCGDAVGGLRYTCGCTWG